MLLIKSTPAPLLRVPTASTVLFCSTTIERVLCSIVNAGFFPSKTRKEPSQHWEYFLKTLMLIEVIDFKCICVAF